MSEWADAQRRMVALGLYTGRIDNDPGEGTLQATLRLLTVVEAATGIKSAPPPMEATSIAAVSGNYPLPAGFDQDYAWLGKIGTLPRLLQEMLAIYGVKETIGTGDNPVIMSWAKETGLADVYVHDSIAWCGLGMAVAVKRAGYAPVAGPLWALNWGKFGVAADKPSLGDILTFKRPGGGHVAQYVGEDSEYYHVIGCNQSDSVSITRIAKGRMQAARRPAYKSPLASWKPYRVASNGAVSTNEA